MPSRLIASLVVYIVWIVATLWGGVLLTQGKETSLEDLVKSGIGWNFIAASVVLLVAIAIFKWRDLRFGRPRHLLRIMWFPSLYLVAFTAGILAMGAPPAATFAIVLFNTMLVGFSEEVMFRGVIFCALVERMAIWPAILLTCVLFGAVHTLNVFITGELYMAAVQSIAAALSGLLFMAILLRTGSIWPAIIYHGLWDCLLFSFGLTEAATQGSAATSMEVPAWASFAPLVLNLPNIIFALFLLRGVGTWFGEREAVSAP